MIKAGVEKLNSKKRALWQPNRFVKELVQVLIPSACQFLQVGVSLVMFGMVMLLFAERNTCKQQVCCIAEKILLEPDYRDVVNVSTR